MAEPALLVGAHATVEGERHAQRATPTSVTATREYATGRNANASTAAATSPSRVPHSRRAAQ